MAGYDMPNRKQRRLVRPAIICQTQHAKETSMTVYNMPNAAKETGITGYDLPNAAKETGMTGYDLPNAAKETITLRHASVGCTSGGVYARKPCIYTHAM